MSLEVQDFIHRIHSGSGARFFRLLFVLIVLAALAALHDGLAYRNFSNREAMDMAQLGKNLADGKGYTTLLVRPFSIFLVRNHQRNIHGLDNPMLKTPHPDLANPPVYPCLLAGLFKLIPQKHFVVPEKNFSIYIPDMAVTVLNQVLFFTAGFLLFFLTSRLLGRGTAWVVGVVFFGSSALWRFSMSGLNTMLLMVLFLGAVWCLSVVEHWLRLGRPGGRLVAMAALAGILIGLGGLTRYSFAWLIVPALIYLAAFFGQYRAPLCLAALAGFMAVMGPWVARNYSVCGMPFGTSTFAVLQATAAFPEDRLERSLHPELQTFRMADAARKLAQNGREVFLNDLPRLGGSWVTAFFLVGLMVPFQKPALSRLRWLLLMSLAVFCLVQPLGRTSLSADGVDSSPENMLIILTPLVFMYGAAMFLLLLDSLQIPMQFARTMIISAFCLVAALPAVQGVLPPYPGPVAYPPYFPPLFQRVGGWFTEQEMIMSDMPWAMGWYARRQCVWATLNWRKDFIEITDEMKPINGIYLTTLTTDSPFLSNWVRGENRSWSSFLLESIVQRKVPDGFPLKRAPDGFFPEQLLLTDYDRWLLKR